MKKGPGEDFVVYVHTHAGVHIPDESGYVLPVGAQFWFKPVVYRTLGRCHISSAMYNDTQVSGRTATVVAGRISASVSVTYTELTFVNSYGIEVVITGIAPVAATAENLTGHRSPPHLEEVC